MGILLSIKSLYTAGISLYRNNLYGNLYMMPISDIWNRIQRVFIVNIQCDVKCDQNMLDMVNSIGEVAILCMKIDYMLVCMTNIGIAQKCCLYPRMQHMKSHYMLLYTPLFIHYILVYRWHFYAIPIFVVHKIAISPIEFTIFDIF